MLAVLFSTNRFLPSAGINWLGSRSASGTIYAYALFSILFQRRIFWPGPGLYLIAFLLTMILNRRSPRAMAVRNQFATGAEVAFGYVQAYYPTLDLRLIAAANPTNLMQYYPFMRAPASTVVGKFEANAAAELLARIQQES